MDGVVAGASACRGNGSVTRSSSHIKTARAGGRTRNGERNSGVPTDSGARIDEITLAAGGISSSWRGLPAGREAVAQRRFTSKIVIAVARLADTIRTTNDDVAVSTEGGAVRCIWKSAAVGAVGVACSSLVSIRARKMGMTTYTIN